MAKPNNPEDFLGLIFKPPKKLIFSRLYRHYFNFILRLLYRIVLFEGIPETVNETFFKLVLFTQGKICFFEGFDLDKNKDVLLALNCSRSDTPDIYYIPSKVIVTNPRLRKSYTLTPGTDCELVYCSESDLYNWSGINGGLYLLIERTATMLADNDISINVAQKNMRLVNLVAADTQNTKDSIQAVIAAMYEGDPNIVVKSSLIDKLQGIPILQNQSNHNLIELIELQQYILAHFYESIGLCTHDQMKRERLITAEINDNYELARFNIDDIIESINVGLTRVNAMFGTEIRCFINPIIEQQRQQQAAASDQSDAAPEGDAAAADDQSEDAAPEGDAAAADNQSDAAPEGDAAAADDQSDAAPEGDAAAPKEVTITGDNNTIVIGGDLDAASEDDSEDVD